MGFHSILAYFTGYKYEPDPEVQPEQEAGRPLHPDMTSIVETIVREKAEQEPEEQAATAEGDVTFLDLMQQYEEPSTAEGPPPLPSVLDGPGSFESPGSLFDTPQDRLIQDDSGLDEGEPDGDNPDSDEDAAAESDAWLSEMGLMGQEDMSLERSLQGQPDTGDRLGLDDMFGQGGDVPVNDTPDTSMGDMFGDEPGYEDLVGEALGGEGEALGGEDDEAEPKTTIEHMEDLLPVDEEDISPVESGDRGFLKSVLLADERMAIAAARRVLASDVTININIGEEDELGEDEELASAEEELGDGLENAAEELGDKLEGAAEELGGEGEPGELNLGGEEELDLGGLGGEAESIIRRVLANEVTININIGEGEEVDIDAPEDLLLEEELDEDFGEEQLGDEGLDLGEDLGELDEGFDEENLKEELGAAPKKGDEESFDELNDLEDVFQSGDEDDNISDFGI